MRKSIHGMKRAQRVNILPDAAYTTSNVTRIAHCRLCCRLNSWKSTVARGAAASKHVFDKGRGKGVGVKAIATKTTTTKSRQKVSSSDLLVLGTPTGSVVDASICNVLRRRFLRSKFHLPCDWLCSS